ncbi:DUF448 domain-containing protein [Candidatus Magnetaquicoccus inordinatus]|uniref:DUF448 domain-containing protein n=1 Tax=Candidatus Magnetaquicoccus inordinatus TaxID=2496818 RepID=UPI00102B6E61|nr:DUF448 domain-containing protein [Candidatus Magnetaquicoccus inordinatus]
MGPGRCVKGGGAKGDGVTDAEEGVFRQCAVTRTRRRKEHLLRLVSDPQGQWTVDLPGRLPGRGVHVLPDPQVVRRFLQRRGGAMVAVDPLLEQVGKALTSRILDGIGLARRAGCLQRGLRDVSEGVAAGAKPLILLAADTAQHTRQKLQQLLHRHAALEMWELLDRERFGNACGSSGPVAVLGVTELRMAERLRHDLLRWREFGASV